MLHRTFAFPPWEDFAVFPILPFPYGVALRNAVLWEQVHPNFHLEGVESIVHLQAIARGAFWSGRFLELTEFVLERAVSYAFSDAFYQMGLVSSTKVEHDFKFLQSALSLQGNHLNEQILRALLQLIMIGDDERNREQRLAGADRFNAEINNLLLKRPQLCHAVQEKWLRFLAYEKGDPTGLGIKSVIVSWIRDSLAGLVRSTVMYPVRNVGTWYIAQSGNTTWSKTFQLYFKKVMLRQKSPLDGLGLSAARLALQTWLVIPPMILLKGCLNVPDELVMRYHFSFLILSVISRDHTDLLQLKGEPKKEQLKKSLNAILRNSAAFSLANWAVSLALYPLSVVRSRLMCQGLDEIPYFYPSTKDAFLTMYRLEGSQAFYGGFYTRALAVRPPLTFISLLTTH